MFHTRGPPSLRCWLQTSIMSLGLTAASAGCVSSTLPFFPNISGISALSTQLSDICHDSVTFPSLVSPAASCVSPPTCFFYGRPAEPNVWEFCGPCHSALIMDRVFFSSPLSPKTEINGGFDTVVELRCQTVCRSAAPNRQQQTGCTLL